MVGRRPVEYRSGMPAPTHANPPVTLRLGVLISGGGTTLLNLARLIDAGQLPAKVATVICSNPSAAGIERSRAAGLPCEVVARKTFNSPSEFSDVVFDKLRAAKVDMVCLAGFLSLLTIPDAFVHRVVNIHPALLPSFGGRGMHGRLVHEAVIAAGCKVSGCTVHYADQTYDTGPIIVQRACPVLEDDTPESLAHRVFEEECLAYPEAIRLIAAGRVRVEGRRAIITPAP